MWDTPPRAKMRKNAAAVALGRLGGLKGGKARARKLTAKQRRATARNAPRFEFAACRDILKALGDERARFDANADGFVTVSNAAEEAWPAEEITITDGSRIKVYPLGTGS